MIIEWLKNDYLNVALSTTTSCILLGSMHSKSRRQLDHANKVLRAQTRSFDLQQEQMIRYGLPRLEPPLGGDKQFVKKSPACLVSV